MNSIDLSKKSLIFITGSSRGIGRAIAVEISRLVHPKSTLVLIASSLPGLEETKSLISKVKNTLNVIVYSLDLSKPSNYDWLFDDALKNADITDLEYSIFFHNAGTIGSLKKAIDLDEIDLWRKYYDLNVISAISLNCGFVSKSKDLVKKMVVINITSLCGRVPFVNMSMYGSGKAARELYFKVFSEEEKNIIVLNYSPGPVSTDMFDTVIQTAQNDDLRKTFKETKDTSILTPKSTVDMLLGILIKGDFKNGDTIDYFDRITQ